MKAPLYDAHCHLADTRLLAYREQICVSLNDIRCEQSVINGTSPYDWQAVIDYAAQYPGALPAIGLHPWQVNGVRSDWKDRFLKYVDQGVSIIGEIGLDQWIKGHKIDAQIEAFSWQLEQATQRNLPVSIHCLKAIDPLLRILTGAARPERGIHLHALNVSVEAAEKLIQMGSYFSFNAGQLKPNATHVYQLIKAIPADRILIETDAPDFLPSELNREYMLPDHTLNHPANLKTSYAMTAAVREQSVDSLREQVAINFRRYFLEP